MIEELSHEQILRYSRHLLMPEVGLQGQIKLKNSSALVSATVGLDYNIWITVYEGDTNPMDVKIDLDRYPDGKLWKTKTKKGKDCVYGLLTIPGSSKKIKVVAFERNRDNIAPVKKEKGSELFED